MCAVDRYRCTGTDTGTVLWARHYSFPYTLLVMDRQQIINYQDFWLLYLFFVSGATVENWREEVVKIETD